MTEIELQYYFHNINTGTMAEWIEQPTFPTASFSFHCIIVKVFYHIIFSPNYRVFSREFLDSSLLETSECQNSRSINFACIYSTCNHLLFSFQSFHQSFCLCTKSKKKSFIYFRSRQGCLLCLIKVTQKQVAGENPAAGEYWRCSTEEHIYL